MTKDKRLQVETTQNLNDLLQLAEINGSEIFHVGKKQFELKFLGCEKSESPAEFLSKGGPLEEGD
ncbi:hypothetical protein [Brucella thiophenivorans]|uniref:Uncharacterized protein n=1 Tax=Brucella thiophenivorans TaxID=571255 RepID=A0A256FK53_9HYPH|nr:hypothetical protein [Brucella thiophenivorans]OYR15232.1 hypothetical protein CEV31_3141 [Brucella thiophenivorans]